MADLLGTNGNDTITPTVSMSGPVPRGGLTPVPGALGRLTRAGGPRAA